MFNTDIPTKLPLPFGADAGAGFIRAIPVASQIGITDGAASLTDGFVPLNATPIAAGGVPPDIKDMNGILFEISGWARWMAAGGPVYFDPDFATAVGGYPKGAAVQSSGTPGVFYVSTVDNNSANPEGGGVPGWTTLVPVPATLGDLIAGTSTTKFVTPATLAGLRASSADVLAGVDAAKYISPAAFYGARASSGDALAGIDDHKYITPAALSGLFAAGITGFRLPGLQVQLGQNRFVTNIPTTIYRQNFTTAFASGAQPIILMSRYDPAPRHYNQKHYVMNGSDENGFNFSIADDDSGDSGSYVYGFDWAAFGPPA